MFAVQHRKIFYIISGTMLGACYLFMVIWGFAIGTDFKGGTIVEVLYHEEAPTKTEVEEKVASVEIGEVSVRPAGKTGYILRTRELSVDEQEALKSSLTIDNREFEIKRLNSVGPLIGQELQDKALIAIVVVILITIIFVAYSFRQVSEPVSSWVYGLVAIVALVHDITIPAGAMVLFGKFAGWEVDVLFITALLSLLGYSINDTIVIFDRIRENLTENKEKNIHESFEDTVGKSLSQTYARSVNTSLTTFFMLISLYVFGGEAIEHFILILIIGTIAGVYSSIYLAAPLLVTINNWRKR